MGRQDGSTSARIVRGALAGIVAGAAASLAMDLFQKATSALTAQDDEAKSEPATVKAADWLSRSVTGQDIAEADKPLAGQAVHYALGTMLGAAYGIAAEFQPGMTAGFGTAWGVATATVLDEAVVPAVGLGEPPWKTGIATHAYGYASHLVFGIASELVRRQVAALLRPR